MWFQMVRTANRKGSNKCEIWGVEVGVVMDMCG